MSGPSGTKPYEAKDKLFETLQMLHAKELGSDGGRVISPTEARMAITELGHFYGKADVEKMLSDLESLLPKKTSASSPKGLGGLTLQDMANLKLAESKTNLGDKLQLPPLDEIAKPDPEMMRKLGYKPRFSDMSVNEQPLYLRARQASVDRYQAVRKEFSEADPQSDRAKSAHNEAMTLLAELRRLDGAAEQLALRNENLDTETQKAETPHTDGSGLLRISLPPDPYLDAPPLLEKLASAMLHKYAPSKTEK